MDGFNVMIISLDETVNYCKARNPFFIKSQSATQSDTPALPLPTAHPASLSHIYSLNSSQIRASELSVINICKEAKCLGHVHLIYDKIHEVIL